MNFAKFAFTDGIKALQQQYGSRDSYARMENRDDTDGLTEAEADFIEQRDSFYMASIGENGYPYIQHRGGPAGFIKVINANTLGVVDFKGNKQYISVGNVLTHHQVSLFLMDYPHKTRLKIYADARIVELADEPALFKLLDPADYKHTPERMILFDVKAFDWNCPQHITPRYTEDEIKRAFAPQNEYVLKLEYELEKLKKQLAGK
ncbi:pyridoxamine 5'-phosphate oxidase family protein [Mucilaginibacter sp.]|uniref:pyridoxamine 5'-phosphate oxidase family protein n=1 Tax=Mucilaginibacter sp. TaxID=1882438 RepID=UPI0032638872